MLDLYFTFSPVNVWVANFTLPKVPFPSDLPTETKLNKVSEEYQTHSGQWLIKVISLTGLKLNLWGLIG